VSHEPFVPELDQVFAGAPLGVEAPCITRLRPYAHLVTPPLRAGTTGGPRVLRFCVISRREANGLLGPVPQKKRPNFGPSPPWTLRSRGDFSSRTWHALICTWPSTPTATAMPIWCMRHPGRPIGGASAPTPQQNKCLRMVEPPAFRLTPEQCRERARECRDIANRVSIREHETILLWMAHSWEELPRP
jgi:hypothetical protein